MPRSAGKERRADAALLLRERGLLFGQGLAGDTMFSSLGLPLSDQEVREIGQYRRPFMAEGEVKVLHSWLAVSDLLSSAPEDMHQADFEAAERRRLRPLADAAFGASTVLESLSDLVMRVSDQSMTAAAQAAARSGFADAAMIRVASGAATEAAYMAALEALGDGGDGPFQARFRLYQAGHWPLILRDGVFYVF